MTRHRGSAAAFAQSSEAGLPGQGGGEKKKKMGLGFERPYSNNWQKSVPLHVPG